MLPSDGASVMIGYESKHSGMFAFLASPTRPSDKNEMQLHHIVQRSETGRRPRFPVSIHPFLIVASSSIEFHNQPPYHPGSRRQGLTNPHGSPQGVICGLHSGKRIH